MRAVSDQYLQAITGPVHRIAEVTVTLPGESEGTEVLLDTSGNDDSSVTMDGSNNARYSASLVLAPDLGSSLWTRISTPGARFTVRAGIDYGGGFTEYVDCGELYATESDLALALGDLPLTLLDGSSPLDELDFLTPWSIEDATDRVQALADIVTDASSDITVVNNATPGNLMSGVVYEKDRLPALEEIAAGGNIDAAFTASGEYLIRDNPIITPNDPDWVLRTGKLGTILEGAVRNVPLAKQFNMVIVLAPEPFQTWGAVTIQIADPNHPRHRDKIGPRPFWVTDSSITSLAQAQQRGRDTLKRILTVVEQIQVPTLGNPALEYGDTITVDHEATAVDPGLSANYLATGWEFNLVTGEQTITGRSTDLPDLEEV